MFEEKGYRISRLDLKLSIDELPTRRDDHYINNTERAMQTKLQQRHAASLAALRAVMATQKAKAKPEWMGWPVLKGGSK